MRLLNVNSFEFANFRDETRPKYVIASHRWVEGSEVTFEDICKRRNTDKSGYKKILAFAKYVREYVPLVEWLWVDTCCINKDSTAELSEAINLMFHWYRDAELCVAYLADVKTADDTSAFERSEWFKRGWTLQELLAPRVLVFVTSTWHVIGNKGASTHGDFSTSLGHGVEGDIARITGIPEQVLYSYGTSLGYSTDERLRWMEGRKTTRGEDMSYALYGIFEVTIGANYGERQEGARQRLLAAIHQRENLAMQQAENYRKIVAWLSPPDPWTSHQSARQLHVPETGSWLLRSDQYRDWKADRVHHLWLYGKAGCGKTVLSSTAIEDVRAYCESHPSAGYAIFYFSFSDIQKQHLVDLRRSLVAQLGWKGSALSMLQQLYAKRSHSLLGLDDLENVLLSCFDSYTEVFLLVDALDECPEDSDGRHDMLESLTTLSFKVRHVKILATSRELPDIRVSMTRAGATPISIATSSVDADIRLYLATQISGDHQLSRLNPETRSLIEEMISQKADGMFRWAYCQLQELKKLKSTRPSFIKEVLYSLPTTLDETYDRILNNVDHMLRKDALTLLRWLAYARSPPSLGELVDATIIDITADGTVMVDDRPGLDDTLEILSGLVIAENWNVDEEYYDMTGIRRKRRDSDDGGRGPSGRQVRLAHFSVKEYLESNRILQSSAKDFHLESAREHGVLSQSCLVYLIHYSSSDAKLSSWQDVETFPLLRYAAKSWFYHAALEQAADDGCVVRFLCDTGALRDWLRVYRPDQIWGRPFGKQEDDLHYLENIGTSLYYASATGLERIVSKLLSAGHDVNSQGGYCGNALQVASVEGYNSYFKIVQILLDAGADVNARGGRYFDALQAASTSGQLKVVRMLLDRGANIHTQGGHYGTALTAAATKGFVRLAQMLIDAGADVNTQGGHCGNPLVAGVISGNERVVQLLLDAGADVNAQVRTFGNALQTASSKGHGHIVRILLDAGAEVNAQVGTYGTALQAAISIGYEYGVRILIDAGADVNAKGSGIYGNALEWAIYGRNKQIVQMLIEAGADVNAKGSGLHGNALQVAMWRGSKEIVQILIDAGADVNARGSYGTALQVARELKQEHIVQVLIGAGAVDETSSHTDDSAWTDTSSEIGSSDED